MNVGIPREVKSGESSVAITPAGVHELVARGHKVFVEHEAGVRVGDPDTDYTAAGAVILCHADDVWHGM